MSIEGEAILCLKQALKVCKNLETDHITLGDREPIWDGSIFVYKDKTHSNKNLIDRCHVQVKGRTHKIKNKDSLTFRLERVHLEKYLIEDGTMFFLINLFEDNHEIYYSSLLPFNIKSLLKETQDAIIKIQLKKFPKTKNEIECIFKNFINDKNRQKSFTTIIDLRDINQSKKFEISYFIPESSVEYHNPIEYIRNNEVYIYCIDEPFVYPVGLVKDILISKNPIINKKIFINGNLFYNEYRVIDEENKSTLYFGKGFSIEFIKNGNDNPKIELVYKGTLNERIKDTTFFIELLKHQIFNIDEIEFPIHLKDNNLNENIDELNGILKKYVEVRCFLNSNNVIKDLNLDSLTDKEINYIFSFVEKFNTKSIKLSDNKEDITYFVPKFGNIKILFICKINDNGTFIIENFFQENFFQKNYNCYGDYKGELVEISQFVILKKDEILKYDNIDYSYIFDNIISKGKNEKYFEIVNLFILELLQAYDETKGINKDLLNLSKKLTFWLIEKNELKKHDAIFNINYFQILRRENTLDEEKRLKLNQIIIENHKNYLILIACYILLDETSSAKYYFQKLSQNDQEKFKTFPIFNLNKFDI